MPPRRRIFGWACGAHPVRMAAQTACAVLRLRGPKRRGAESDAATIMMAQQDPYRAASSKPHHRQLHLIEVIQFAISTTFMQTIALGALFAPCHFAANEKNCCSVTTLSSHPPTVWFSLLCVIWHHYSAGRPHYSGRYQFNKLYRGQSPVVFLKWSVSLFHQTQPPQLLILTPLAPGICHLQGPASKRYRLLHIEEENHPPMKRGCGFL